MNEVGELAGLVARQEQPRATHEEDLRPADARRVQLVVHDDRARALERDGSAVLTEPLRRAAVGLTQGASERDLDARGEVVVVLLPRELGYLAGDLLRGPGRRRLEQEIEPALRAEGRAGLGLVDQDHVGPACSDVE